MISRREQNRSEQRERILGAARTLFGDRGFDAVTMGDIAAKAGVARATVFNYFPSKHALVESITEEVFRYFHGMIEVGLADERTPVPSLLRSFFAHMGEGIEAYQRFYSGAFREILKIQVDLDEHGEARAMRDAALANLQRLMARGQERGELRRDASPADLASAYNALSNGTIVHWLFEDASSSLRERMERAVEIFLGPVAEADFAEPDGSLSDFTPLEFDPAGPPTNRGPDATR